MSSHAASTPHYFVPASSSRPVSAAVGLLLIFVGATQWLNAAAWAKWSMLAGLACLVWVLFGWFGDVVREGEHQKLYGRKIDLSFRWSMSWFIFSEVIFFGVFFTALWWLRAHSVPMLGNDEHALLWEGFKAVWPSVQHGATASPANIIEPFEVMTPFWLPTINTALLLSSGVTMTVAHHALLDSNRAKAVRWMVLTLLLGFTFLCVQGYEYYHAYTGMNLKLSSGAYGSTFFMLTGFHGFHVFVGLLMLFFITLRLGKGHFDSKHHFGFEGAAWYWHFVDVVWLGLYILVYWL